MSLVVEQPVSERQMNPRPGTYCNRFVPLTFDSKPISANLLGTSFRYIPGVTEQLEEAS